MRFWGSLQDFDRLRSDALSDFFSVDEALRHLEAAEAPVMRIYYGPPGTGKTLTAVQAAVRLADPTWSSAEADPIDALKETFEHFWALGEQVEFVTFSPSDQYETVVEAIRPHIADEDSEAGSAEPGYHYWEGPILRSIRHARRHAELPHVLVIDEINRADISQVLGPLIAAIEADKRQGALFPVPFQVRYGAESHNEYVPANLHILGTMNSADRNLALVDVALRRRFEFIRLNAKPQWLGPTKDIPDPVDMGRLLASLNARIGRLIGSDFEIGHSYFMGIGSNAVLVRTFVTKIIPLLEEYFYGDDAAFLLVVGEHPDAPTNDARIFDVGDTGAASLGKVFLGEKAAQVAAAHMSGSRDVTAYQRTLRKAFWDFDADPPQPGNLDDAVRALIKIYEPSVGKPDSATAPV